MKTPNIYDFMSPAEIMIIKNLAYLRMKEKKGQLTSMEKDMLHETHHFHQLCMYYYATKELRPYFTSANSMELNLNDYVTALVHNHYNLGPGEVNEAIDLLMDSAAATLFSPVNYVFPCLVTTQYGEVIICCDLRKQVNLMTFDRLYVGFTAFFVYNIKNGVNREEILERLRTIIHNYLIQEDCSWITMSSLSTPDIDNYIVKKAEEMYAQLLYYANNGR